MGKSYAHAFSIFWSHIAKRNVAVWCLPLPHCTVCWCLAKRAASAGRMLSEVSFFLLCPPPHTQQQSFPLIPLSLVLHLLLCHCNTPHVERKPKPLKNGLCPFAYEINSNGRRQEIWGPPSVFLCFCRGGEGLVRQWLGQLLLQPPLRAAPTFQMLLFSKWSNHPGSSCCSGKEEMLLSFAGCCSPISSLCSATK